MNSRDQWSRKTELGKHPPMLVLDEQNVCDYLRANHVLRKGDQVRVNQWASEEAVLLWLWPLEKRHPPKFVIKQARPLPPDEVALDEFHQEAEILNWCSKHVDSALTPNGKRFSAFTILFQDRSNAAFAYANVPYWWSSWRPYHRSNWSTSELQDDWVIGCGDFLARMHAQSWENAGLAAQFGNRSRFERTWRQFPNSRLVSERWRPIVERTLASIDGELRSLIHGNPGPPTLICGPTFIGWELSHFGDPAWDVGNFLGHLLALFAMLEAQSREVGLTLIRKFWRSYAATLGEARIRTASIERRAIDIAQVVLLRLATPDSGIDLFDAQDWSCFLALADAIQSQHPETMEALSRILLRNLPTRFTNAAQSRLVREEPYRLP